MWLDPTTAPSNPAEFCILDLHLVIKFITAKEKQVTKLSGTKVEL